MSKFFSFLDLNTVVAFTRSGGSKAVIWAKSEGLIVCGGKESNEGRSKHKPPSHAAPQGNVTSTCNVNQNFAEFLKLSKKPLFFEG